MTIKELKEKIMFLDDNMKVGGSGHFGEFLQTVGKRKVVNKSFNYTPY